MPRAAAAFSGWCPRWRWERWARCSGSRSVAWRDPAPTGIACWKYAPGAVVPIEAKLVEVKKSKQKRAGGAKNVKNVKNAKKKQ